jgi:uncharacterized lipoprotein YddW (UPF0748 family)
MSVFLLAFVFAQEAFPQYHPKTEMRAVWIATVNNIDWPSKPGLTTEEQKKEMTTLLDIFTSYNLNTVIFQVRPAADAFYPSAIEPWSWWLTGEQGKAPEPVYDPLAFMIGECRKRGLDIHVWLNPYRAVTDTANIVSANHITNIHPEWFLTYGKTVYFDPGLPQTSDHVSRVVGDIVRRYDIDAVHMDDYFYPYRIAGKEFPDDSSFSKYPNGFNPGDKENWRRENVNRIIRQISDTIKKIKPWVEFGISPFGVWRNRDKDALGSDTKAGQTNYDDLYADILLWQKQGWIDYVVPQIYWHIGFDVADYEVLSDWWSRNTYGCRLYIGQAPYRINSKAAAREWRSSAQIIRQVQMNRTIPLVSGSVYFSAKVLKANPLHLKEKLTRVLYRYPALPPSNKKIDPLFPDLPAETELTLKGDSICFSWTGGENTKKFVIYKLRKNKPADLNDPANIFHVTSDTMFSAPARRKNDPGRYYYMVSSVSRTNIESDPVFF